MQFVRSDSPDVARSIATANTLARRHEPLFLLGLLPNLAILSITLLSLIFFISVRAAVRVALPGLLVWNAWVVWRARSPRLSWVMKSRDQRFYIRLFVGFGKAWRATELPDVLVLEASEIASMSLRSIEVFLYGPKPDLVEWLVIEPAQAIAEGLSNQIPSYLWESRTADLSDRPYWESEKRRLAVGWKGCRPALRVLLQEVAREGPSVAIGPEDRSELDLNGIWRRTRGSPDEHERRMLVQAMRLGFGCRCIELTSRHRHLSWRRAGAFLAEIKRGETGPERSAIDTSFDSPT